MNAELKTYCIIGDPIDHSFSPAIYNAAFNSLGLNCTYIAFRVQKDELRDSLDSLRAINIGGFNVTMPHKIKVLNYVDYYDKTVEMVGAANTVNNDHGKFRAYNTDVIGFIKPLHERKISFNGFNVLILGAGGAARAIVVALAHEKGIANINIFNRNTDRSEKLSNMIKKMGLESSIVSNNNIQQVASKSHLIINTTPLGMKNEKSLINSTNIRTDAIVYDIVYKPINTDLIKNAKTAGAEVVYGYEMLLKQAIASFKIWIQKDPPLDSMKKVLFGMFGEPV
ncbi:MAG: shikimate dehydrogenase [Thaumarchaeota archaeon]|nr:MAG: shikimate dehydrogenase [Nitrososphaerota archaeon]TLX89895.1 MAG: shikimate dehydrogenase [Nitrososphaerota archaeon]